MDPLVRMASLAFDKELPSSLPDSVSALENLRELQGRCIIHRPPGSDVVLNASLKEGLGQTGKVSIRFLQHSAR